MINNIKFKYKKTIPVTINVTIEGFSEEHVNQISKEIEKEITFSILKHDDHFYRFSHNITTE